MDETYRDFDERPREPRENSLEGRENQLIAYAVDLAEKQLREGTASAQVITHYLKLGSTRERKEQAKLEKEIELAQAKIEALQSAEELKDLYKDAMEAMRSYNGSSNEDS